MIAVAAMVGATVRAGETLFIMEAMKMEHEIAALMSGVVREVAVAVGDTLFEGHPLAFLEEAEVEVDALAGEGAVDRDEIRPDLAEVLARQARALDAARPEAVARRRKTGQRTTRENIDDLLDPGSFQEYGALNVAARRRRHSLEELIAQTPADGMVMGLGQVNGSLFPEERARVAVMAYDYTVLAGTQGAHNHDKLDRMSELALRWRLPTVFTTGMGGGGQAGRHRGQRRLHPRLRVLGTSVERRAAGRHHLRPLLRRQRRHPRLLRRDRSPPRTRPSAWVARRWSRVAASASSGPDEIGPVKVMQANGTIDVLVDDEAAAVAAGKQYLSYFQGPVKEWACADQRLLRRAIPENRLRVYDVRKVIELIADTGSVLELRPKFGLAMITAFIRVEGRPVGVFANNPHHLGGAIDADGSDKAARFMQLCEAFDIPMLFALRTPPATWSGPRPRRPA